MSLKNLLGQGGVNSVQRYDSRGGKTASDLNLPTTIMFTVGSNTVVSFSVIHLSTVTNNNRYCIQICN